MEQFHFYIRQHKIGRHTIQFEKIIIQTKNKIILHTNLLLSPMTGSQTRKVEKRK